MTSRGVIGWDIGGVNTKMAHVAGGEVLTVRERPFEVQRAPAALAALVRALASDLDANPKLPHAVTMTAELSQMFRTKREGVNFVLDAVAAAFPISAVWVYTVGGRFLQPIDARQQPHAIAAANWAATAHIVADRHPDALLVDIGTTTTDIIPIVGGKVVALGRTDPERLASGELVYTGAVRTPAEAIARHVPLGDGVAGTSAEGFAVAGDVHLWRGDLAAADYTSPTPDGRPASREFAGERLARVVCADREMLDELQISAIAEALAEAQVATIGSAIRRVLAQHLSIRTAVVAGLGAFLAARAARAAGLQVLSLAADLGDQAARCAPAGSVALLLERELTTTSRPGPGAVKAPQRMVTDAAPSSIVPCVDTVVKLGGGLLAHDEHFNAAIKAIADAARHRRLLVVPGGGPFADVVRSVDQRLNLPDDASHWMAVIAMDQYAHLVAAQLSGGLLVAEPCAIAAALEAQRLPILAPSRWLREADPLPHTWDVTSDSIAAWVAGAVGATRLVLIKPPGVRSERCVGSAGSLPKTELVDGYFSRVLSPSILATIVAADDVSALQSALRA